jgi:hypothetical protein
VGRNVAGGWSLGLEARWGEEGRSLAGRTRFRHCLNFAILLVGMQQAWKPGSNGPSHTHESHHPELPVMPVVPSVLVMGAKLATLANVDTYPMRVASITVHS